MRHHMTCLLAIFCRVMIWPISSKPQASRLWSMPSCTWSSLASGEFLYCQKLNACHSLSRWSRNLSWWSPIGVDRVQFELMESNLQVQAHIQIQMQIQSHIQTQIQILNLSDWFSMLRPIGLHNAMLWSFQSLNDIISSWYIGQWPMALVLSLPEPQRRG